LHEISRLRLRIDEIDHHLVKLLNARFENAQKLGRIKKSEGLAYRDLERESEILSNVRQLAIEMERDPELLGPVFQQIFKMSVKAQKNFSKEHGLHLRRQNVLVVGGTGGPTTGGGNAFQEFDVGITLKVTPQISSDGFVLLDIDAESSELTDASVRPTGAGSAFPLIPDELRRTASSNVLIRAGETFVLGGILQDNLRQQERGIPYLRDTPGLGWLFRGRNNSRVKDELLVFITPKLAVGTSTTGLPTAQQLWESRPREVTPPEVVHQ